MLLATPYMGIMTIVRLAVAGTMIQQAIQTTFGSFSNYAIANCDTVPAAIFVNVIAHVVETVELENYQTWASQQAFLNTLAKYTSGNNGTRRMLGADPADGDSDGSDGAAMDLCISSGPGSGHSGQWPIEYVEYGCYDRAASTILAATMVTGIAVGLIMMLMGTKIKAGPLVSFIPITVQAAFLAGCGASIFKKGMKFMVDVDR